MERGILSALRRSALVLLLTSGAALAGGEDGQRGHHPGARWVPEFDPAAAGVIAAVVAGGGVLIARRSRRPGAGAVSTTRDGPGRRERW